jgi:hypothetical protein
MKMGTFVICFKPNTRVKRKEKQKSGAARSQQPDQSTVETQRRNRKGRFKAD